MQKEGFKQKEVPVHSSIPPLVSGRLRGHLMVAIEGGIEWKHSVGPPAPKLSVKFSWWGQEGQPTVFRVPVALGHSTVSTQGSCAYFPVRSGLPQINAYLKDMGGLRLDVGLGHMKDESMMIGYTQVDSLSALPSKKTLYKICPIMSSGGALLGQLRLQFQLLMSSDPASMRGGITEEVVGVAVHNTISSDAEGGRSPPPPESTVREGASIKKANRARRARTLSPHPTDSRKSEEGSNTPSTVRWNILRSGSKSSPPPLPAYSDAVEWKGKAESVRSLGSSQLAMLEDLIEKGTGLHSRMVQSLLRDCHELEEDEKITSEEKVDSLDLTLTSILVEESRKEDDGKKGVHKSPIRSRLLYSSVSSGEEEENTEVDKLQVKGGCVTVDSVYSMDQDSDRDQHQSLPSNLQSHKPTLPPRPSSLKRSTTVNVKERVILPSVEAGKEVTPVERVEPALLSVELVTRLARATAARVMLHTLTIDTQTLDRLICSRNTAAKRVKSKRKGVVITGCATCIDATFFVEYRFPMMERQQQRTLTEVMRIACRKMKKKGEVGFHHRSVFPVRFSEQDLKKWHSGSITFTVYCRPQGNRMPFVVGQGPVFFGDLLASPTLSMQSTVKVMADASLEGSTNTCIGHLQVSVVLVEGKTPFPPVKLVGEPVENGRLHCEVSQPAVSSPIKLQEEGVASASVLKSLDTEIKMPGVQLLLLSLDGLAISLPSPQPSSVPPNCYLISKLFCSLGESPRSDVVWGSVNPVFNMRLVFPLMLTPELLDKLCNKMCVVEVWHHVPADLSDPPTSSSRVSQDLLVGLVKLSLHQFFLAYRDPTSVSVSMEAKQPVVAMDAYCPIVEPISGKVSGHLAILLAMGTPDQVSYLIREHAAGLYPLHRPHLPGLKSGQVVSDDPTLSAPGGSLDKETEDSSLLDGVAHEFTLHVCGVRGLEVESGMVWGEADCYVQYHFPTLTQNSNSDKCDIDNGEQVSLEVFRTCERLFVPDPVFDSVLQHTLTLNKDQVLPQVLAVACGNSGLSGAIPFEFWTRFYQPNIRNQLLAKAQLPLVKLCALVGMQASGSTNNSQTFSLPLEVFVQTGTNKTTKSEVDGAVLEVSVTYRPMLLKSSVQRLPSDVKMFPKPSLDDDLRLSVSIVQLTGLKCAAMLAARAHPLTLDGVENTGVNAYVSISCSALQIQNPLKSKVTPSGFCPELRQVFEITLPSPEQSRGEEELAFSLMQASLTVEVWHQTPTSQFSTLANSKVGVVKGRKLPPSQPDVLLGVAHVPLLKLLSYNGIHGWYPLYPPSSSWSVPTSGPSPYSKPMPSSGQPPSVPEPPAVKCSMIGGVEMGISFSSTRDRELLLAAARRCGLDRPHLHYRKDSQEGPVVGESWELVLAIEGMWTQNTSRNNESLALTRYRFFDLEPVSSRPVSSCHHTPGSRGSDGPMQYHAFKHKARITLPSSDRFQWYLSEEHLEIQVWTCPAQDSTKLHLSSCGQKLLGSAYISLVELISTSSSSSNTISGWFPIFKAGVQDMGTQSLYLSLALKSLSEPHPQATVTILDSESESHRAFTSSVSDPCVSGAEKSFEAQIIVHQALHLAILHSRRDVPGDDITRTHVRLCGQACWEDVVSADVAGVDPVWDFHAKIHIPTQYLHSECPGLELQVWSGTGSDGGQQQQQEEEEEEGGGDGGEETITEWCIGRTLVDVSALACGLPYISGWYNVYSLTGQVQGQLKVSVVPSSGLDKSAAISPAAVTTGPAPISALPLLISPTSTTPSTSVLLQKLQDNMRDLDQIQHSFLGKFGREDEQQGRLPLSSVPSIYSSIEPKHCTNHSTQVSVHTSQHLPGHQVSSQHLPEHQVSSQHPPGHQVSSQHLPEHQVSLQHPPGHQVSLQHPPGHQVSLQHPPGHQVSLQHPPGHQVSLQHPPGHQVSSQHPPGHQVSSQHPPGHQMSSQHPTEHQVSLQHPPGHQVSSQHPPGHQVSLQHPPGHQVSLQHPPGHQMSSQHPPEHQVSLQHPPGHQMSSQHPPEHQVSSQHPPEHQVSLQHPPGHQVSSQHPPGHQVSLQHPPLHFYRQSSEETVPLNSSGVLLSCSTFIKTSNDKQIDVNHSSPNRSKETSLCSASEASLSECDGVSVNVSEKTRRLMNEPCTNRGPSGRRSPGQSRDNSPSHSREVSSSRSKSISPGLSREVSPIQVRDVSPCDSDPIESRVVSPQQSRDVSLRQSGGVSPRQCGNGSLSEDSSISMGSSELLPRTRDDELVVCGGSSSSGDSRNDESFVSVAQSYSDFTCSEEEMDALSLQSHDRSHHHHRDVEQQHTKSAQQPHEQHGASHQHNSQHQECHTHLSELSQNIPHNAQVHGQFQGNSHHQGCSQVDGQCGNSQCNKSQLVQQGHFHDTSDLENHEHNQQELEPVMHGDIPSPDHQKSPVEIGEEVVATVPGVSNRLPERLPELPNFFLSPQQLEQSLRTVHRRALSRPFPTPLQHPPSQPSPVVSSSSLPGTQPTKWKTTTETQRIYNIFLSKH